VKTRNKIIAGIGSAAMAATLMAVPQIASAGHANGVATADLDGRQEVDNSTRDQRIVGDPNGRGEAYVFGIDNAPGTICYVLVAERIDELDLPPGAIDGSARAAHIHEGARGENGPVVVTLAWPQGGTASDCKDVGPELASEILGHPDNYYINVHNEQYPAGAIRGQLRNVGN
jgi:hypothetical protein